MGPGHIFRSASNRILWHVDACFACFPQEFRGTLRRQQIFCMEVLNILQESIFGARTTARGRLAVPRKHGWPRALPQQLQSRIEQNSRMRAHESLQSYYNHAIEIQDEGVPHEQL